MAGTNDFKAIATGVGANVLAQGDFAALSTFLANGYSSGVVASDRFNKIIRQSSFMSAVLGQLVANANINAVDDGDIPGFVTDLGAAILASLPNTMKVRAWVVFDGVSSASILSSFNIASVTRNSTGDYTLAFTTAMTDANYALAGINTAEKGGANIAIKSTGPGDNPTLKSTSQVRIVFGDGAIYTDVKNASVIVVGN